MAGSLKWFEYTTDSGDVFGVFMDESNGEAVDNPDWTDASDGVYKLPSNVKPRRARYTSAGGQRAANIIVCDPEANITSLPSTIDFAIPGDATPVTLTLRELTGEKIVLIPRPDDTGLSDGDGT